MGSVEIDFKIIRNITDKEQLRIEDALYLYLLYEKEPIEASLILEVYVKDDVFTFLKSMETRELLKIVGENLPEDIIFREKFINLVVSRNLKNKVNVDFDEFWDVFPITTIDGRPLRPVNKEFKGILTRDYEVCKAKYLKIVKTSELHEFIIKVIKHLASIKDTKYMNNMETYINQRVWEKDSIKLNKPSKKDYGEVV